MSRNGTLAMYDEFDDNDNIEGNDDDMAALGSILSWDEAEENDNVASNKSDDEITGTSGRTNSSSGPTPFETMHFSARNGNPSLNFLQNSSSSAFSQNTAALQQELHLPMSVIADFGQQQQVPGSQQISQASLPETATVVDQQQLEQHSNANQPQQLGMQLNFSPEQQQFIAQNPQAFAQFLASTVLQQQGQQQLHQPQQQNQPQLQAPLTMFQNNPVQQPVQQSQVPPRKQEPAQLQQQSQLPYTSDANSLLQQFQMAQFQQQLQVAQAQQQASATQPNLQIQNALQQLQAQFAQVQGTVAHPSSAQASRQANAEQVSIQPIAPQQSGTRMTGASSQMSKKHKLVNRENTKKSVIKAAPKTKVSVTKSTDTSMAGTVSASDTEVEAFRKVKSSRPILSPTNDDDDIDLSHLSPSEKLKSNRDRNREHARNTRLRKKAYLEKLKSTVDELCRERDTLVSERAGAASLLVEMHNIRTEVLMSFMALRTSNERRRKLWSSILDESCFACVMPVTPYRSFPASEVQVSKCLRTVLGIDGMIADTASLHVLFDSLVDRSLYPYGKIDFRYTLVTEEAVVAGNQMMARWVMTTTNAVHYGARMEVAKQGMLCCKFNSAHKIIGLELMFDVMAFMLQLKQASGSEGFTVIPNTVQTCQRSFDKPMVVTLAEPPYTIIQVNKLWEVMTGYAGDEVVGRTSCSILQGVDMDKACLNRMMDEVRYKRPASAMLVNRRKMGEDFTNFLVIYPLSTDSKITYYLGLTLYNSPGKPSRTTGSTQADSIHQSVPQNPASSVSGGGVLGNQEIRSMHNQSVMSSVIFPGLCSLPSTNQQSSLAQLCTTTQTPYVQPVQTGSGLANIGSNMGNLQNNSPGSLKRHRESDPDCGR